MKERFLCFLLVLCMTLTSLPVSVLAKSEKSATATGISEIAVTSNEESKNATYEIAELMAVTSPEVVNSGEFSGSLTWTFYEDGTLRISGTGKMVDYYRVSSVPWYSYRSQIKIAILENGITSVGKYSFAECESLVKITIPESVVSINYSFYACTSLKEITLPHGVTSIGAYSFENCTSLTKITIPSSLTSVGREAFNGCSSLINIYYHGTQEQWGNIAIGVDNAPLANAHIRYNYNGKNTVQRGDLDGDGEVTQLDCDLLAEATVGMASLSEEQTYAADLNGDGKISASDFSIMKQYLAGSIDRFPVEIIDSGECGADGDNLTWIFYDDGELLVRGAGKMADYDFTNSSPYSSPWSSYSKQIQIVTLESGVTSIGKFAFLVCSMTQINIP